MAAAAAANVEVMVVVVMTAMDTLWRMGERRKMLLRWSYREEEEEIGVDKQHSLDGSIQVQKVTQKKKSSGKLPNKSVIQDDHNGDNKKQQEF